MCESAKGTCLVKLLETDDLYSFTGHPLTRTYYSYDREGMIRDTLKLFYYCENAVESLEFSMRETTRDPYHIITTEEIIGEDSVPLEHPRIILYEQDEDGRVARVVEAAMDTYTKKRFPIIYTIGYENTRPHQRGHIIRERQLDSDGSFEWEYQYEYDDHGWKIRTNQISTDGQEKSGKKKQIEYDVHGNTVYCNNGRGREYAIKNTYDEDGYLKTAIVSEKNWHTGEWAELVRHEYGYEEVEIDLPEHEKPPEPT